MKGNQTMKKTVSFLLAVLILISLCGAVSHADSATSNTGVGLELPADGDYYASSVTAFVKAAQSGGSIYIMPRPQAGNGNLGTVKDGEQVTILAGRSGYYFFRTSDGRQGWNEASCFLVTGTPGSKSASNYSTVSTTGVSLELPAAADYYEKAVVGYVKSTKSGGAIYIMPAPKAGTGVLGTIADGTKVYITAGRGGFYFFEAEDGRKGWNGAPYFTVAETPERKESYSTISNKGVELEMPKADEYYANVFLAYTKSQSTGRIYIMPVPDPKSGHGVLGTLKDGTMVYILAYRGGFYFFETEDGRKGWNGTVFFDVIPGSGGGKQGSTPGKTYGRTVSNTGVALEYPTANDYYENAVIGYVKSTKKGGSIYLMPTPKTGNGNLGTVADGTRVFITAGRNGFYFVETEDGRMGWNGPCFFTVEETPVRRESYSTVSNKGVELEMPKSGEYYEYPFLAYTKSQRTGRIYIMPVPDPKSGHGVLGTLKDGTLVHILAYRGGFYFFETEDGRKGWNGTVFFDVIPGSGSGKSGSVPSRSDYNTVSTTGVALEMPASADYYKNSFVGYVKSTKSGGSIYLMPTPKAGNGVLGTVADGTRVYILAQRSGFYFVVTEDGRMGWNGKPYFRTD